MARENRIKFTAVVRARFWAKVNKGGPIPPHCPELGSCWVWLPSCDPPRYGQFDTAGRTWAAHRLVFVMEVGPIPGELWVLHHCDNPCCVRPAHLFLGTHTDNMRDAAGKGRTSTHAHPETASRGEEHYHAAFTEEQIRMIRRRCAARTISQRDLAAEMGVSQSAIMCVVTRRTWKHVE